MVSSIQFFFFLLFPIKNINSYTEEVTIGNDIITSVTELMIQEQSKCSFIFIFYVTAIKLRSLLTILSATPSL